MPGACLLAHNDPTHPEFLVFQRPVFGRMDEPDWADLKIVSGTSEEASWILGSVGQIPQPE